MTKLILIRGNAASGKTSLATALQAELGENTLLLSQDNIRRTMLAAHDGPDTPTIPLLRNLLIYGKTHCDYLILEGILRADWYTPIWETITDLFGSKNTYAYYYDLPFEDTLRRHSSRAKSQEFGEKSLRRWWNDNDYLTHFSEKKIATTSSLSDSLETILQDIKQ